MGHKKTLNAPVSGLGVGGGAMDGSLMVHSGRDAPMWMALNGAGGAKEWWNIL